jgi:hypothetical protein
MTHPAPQANTPLHSSGTPDRLARPFGLPLGDLGWFSSLLMGVAAGFGAFFATTFVAIMSLLAYVTFSHHPMGSVDFALTYRRVGFPVGVTVMTLSLAYLGTLWARRKIRRA